MDNIKTYNDLCALYNEEDYFDILELNIKIKIDITDNAIENRRAYVFDSLEIKKNIRNNNFSNNVVGFVEQFNSEFKKFSSKSDSQLFYIYKEILQFFNIQMNFNYFRGQINFWSLTPGILRNSVTDEYRKDFEYIYKKLSNEFPKKIEYFDASSLEKRASQISVLQHFGLKTALLDITSNPYIALLFMLEGKLEKDNRPTLYLFDIQEKEKEKTQLFVDVKKHEDNERIIAQKGAFLNFDNLFLQNSFTKIPTIKIVLICESTSSKKAIENNGISLADKESKQILEMYEQAIPKVVNVLDSMEEIRKEMLKKLKECYYTEENLYPDFEKRIEYISRNYTSEKFQKFKTRD